MDFNINKLPSSWSDIKICQYVKLRPVIIGELNPIERVIFTLAILLDKPTQDVEKLKLTDITKINERLKFLQTTPIQTTIPTEIFLKGNKYKFITDATELNGGQYMSVTTKLQQAQEDEEYIYNNLHEVLASISEPIGKEIDSNYYKETASIFYEHLTVADAYPICFFFSKLSELLTEITVNFSKKKLQKAEDIVQELEMDLLKNGGGL